MYTADAHNIMYMYIYIHNYQWKQCVIREWYYNNIVFRKSLTHQKRAAAVTNIIFNYGKRDKLAFCSNYCVYLLELRC